MRTFAYGLFPTSFAVFFSLVLAKWGFENIYYAAQLLPICMVFYIVLAWLMYLKHSFPQKHHQSFKKEVPSSLLEYTRNNLSGRIPEDKIANSDADGPQDNSFISNQSEITSTDSKNSGFGTVFILLWSAGQIAIIATILYHWFGIGASYY